MLFFFLKKKIIFLDVIGLRKIKRGKYFNVQNSTLAYLELGL